MKRLLPFVLLIGVMIAIPVGVYFLRQFISPTATSQATPTPTPIKQVLATPSVSPNLSCAPRPACLDSTPPCQISQPAGGWCPLTITTTPSSSIIANVSIVMPGIGVGGNTNPKTTSRSAEISFYSAENQLANTVTGAVTFDGTKFNGAINLGNQIHPGSYIVKIKLENTLKKQTPGVLIITGPNSHTLSSVTLVPGDLNQDNVIDSNDSTIFTSCYQEKPCTQKTLVDFNDDGTVDGIDYNILLRSFSARQGD